MDQKTKLTLTIVCFTLATLTQVQTLKSRRYKNTEDSSEGRKESSFKTFGTYHFETGTCKNVPNVGQKCRTKRSLNKGPHLNLHIQTEEKISDRQQTDGLVLRLKRSIDLVAPHFKLVVRNGSSVSVNKTVPLPSCLYEGSIMGFDKSKAAISTCHKNRLSGIILTEDQEKLVLEEITEDHEDFDKARIRRKREDAFAPHDDDEGLVKIFSSEASGGDCGIKKSNLQKMMAPQVEAVLLEAKKLSKEKMFVRKKRQSTMKDKAIEIAVFVDDELYGKEAQISSDPIQSIQNLVFTYLNAVQLLYNSEVMSTQFRLILVRLEILQTAVPGLYKTGDIENYLDSFCGWQKTENPGANMERRRADADEPEHWDHSLMLTGLNLYDGTPTYDSVIGLAWVSGMCHPAYSCTINEGNNYESVFVIAHEMGHNLGMNHDGETNLGNTCDPDKYLMSPVLGPGKVTWSSCSNKEVAKFLTGRITLNGTRLTRIQADCLNDLPTIMDQYDYLKDNMAPGEKVSSLEQCVRAFGSQFSPHVVANNYPFDNLCRELWCSNGTHAMRAHPALEGTDCSSTPYPYGSICVGGLCTEFDPDNPYVPTYGSETKGLESKPQEDDPSVSATASGGSNSNQTRPEWHDPIHNKLLQELRNKISEKYPMDEDKVRTQPLKDNDLDTIRINEFGKAKLHEDNFVDKPRWTVQEPDCPVECGGSWVDVTVTCTEDNHVVEDSSCDAKQRPHLTRTTCNLKPCV